MPAESVAIIGAGIAGLGAAWTLEGSHDVHLFERDDRLGGHTYTVSVRSANGARLNVDTGFIVYNETTYPLLTRLLDRLGVDTRASNMSFSLECGRCGVVYSGLGPWGVFADPRNALRPAFLRFLWEVGRFNRRGLAASHRRREDEGTLGRYLDRAGFGGAVARHYALPLASALWSTGIPDVRDFPFRTFDAFFRSHRLYTIRGRLAWRTVKGGSRAYVDAMRDRMSAAVRTGSAVVSVHREGRQVRLGLGDGSSEVFDRVVIATHADDALALLADPTDAERELLGAWRYAESDTWLHSDGSALPDAPRAHASWNYRLEDCEAPAAGPTMTYHLNRLQNLNADQPFLVTLNPSAPPDRVHLRRRYRHPIFTPQSVATQALLAALGDDTRTYFCGAHLGFGFHEDGLRSGVEVGLRLGGTFA